MHGKQATAWRALERRIWGTSLDERGCGVEAFGNGERQGAAVGDALCRLWVAAWLSGRPSWEFTGQNLTAALSRRPEAP